MGLFDFLKSKKRKKEPVPEAGTEEVIDLGDVEQLEIDAPETRYTQEYQDFLAAQEAAEGCEASEEEPETDEEDPEAFE